MNGGKGLIESIEKAAEKERDAIIKDAKNKADKILEDSEKQASKIKEDFFKERDIVLLTEASKIRNEARREIQEKIFSLKNNILEECFSKVLDEVSEIKKDRKAYKKILKSLLDESVIGFDESKKVVIKINKRFRIVNELLHCDYSASLLPRCYNPCCLFI